MNINTKYIIIPSHFIVMSNVEGNIISWVSMYGGKIVVYYYRSARRG